MSKRSEPTDPPSPFAPTAAPPTPAQGDFERQLRDMNEALLVSSVHQHELTEKAQKAEAALRDSQEQLRRNAETFSRFVEHAPFGIYVVDSDFRIAQVNDGAQAAFRNVKPLIGRDFSEAIRIIWPEPLAGEVIGIFRRTLETGEPYLAPSLTEQRNDIGTTESYEWQSHRVTLADGKHGVVCYFFDATRVRQTEHALRESEERFRTLADNMAPFAWTADAAGSIYWYNRRWYEYTGSTPQESRGEGWKKFHHPDHLDRVTKSIQRALDTGEDWEDTFPLRGKDGEYRWFLSRSQPIRDANGAIVRWFGTHTDITDQKRATSAAEEANRAKDKFLAVLSHELRTPLAPVLMTITAMDMNPDLPPRFRDDVAMIRRNVELEAKLIDDLLDLSRITSGKLRLQFEFLDVNELVRHVCETCRGNMLEKGIHLHADLNENVNHVVGDPGRLQQVFWNLLSNATKFTPQGGHVYVTTENVQGAGPGGEGAQMRVTVRDTGIGIPPEMLPRIFDAFEQGDTRITRQFGGLGLGLSISKLLVEQHRGCIRAQTEGPNKGSTFIVELPAQIQDSEAPSSAKSVPGDDGKIDPLRVLVVEDHADTAAVLGKLLTASGHAVRTTTTAAGALALASEHPFDLIVSDLGLPDTTGYELMKQIKQRYGTKGIAMSGYGMEEDIKKSEQAGFSDHLVKPVNFAQLEQSIRRVAGNGRAVP